MEACLLLASVAFASGFASGMRFRIWALVPLAVLIVVAPGLCAIAAPATSPAFVACLASLIALQCGFLAGASARVRA